MPNYPDDATQFGDLAPYYDELMQGVPYAHWAEYVMELFVFAGHTPRRGLDCACGTGNVTFELAQQGLEMTGIDLSEAMLRVARAKAQAAATPIRFVQADLTDFDLGETFDSATCLYDSLNYILDPAALQAAFGCIARHVEPGGVFVFDMNSDFAFQANLFTQSSRNPNRALHYDWKADFDPQTRICTVQMEFALARPDGRRDVFHELHHERAYERPAIEAMLAATGWNLLHSFDAYTFNRPQGRSERWYFVARRTG